MNYKRLLNTKVGIIFISIMLGLGLAVLFRSACNGKDCLNFKGPKFSDIKGKTYQFGDSCYKYNAVSSKCDSNKQTLAFSNDESKYSEFEGFADASTKVDLELDEVNSFVSKSWDYITRIFYYMTLG
jgi:hypothetical protein